MIGPLRHLSVPLTAFLGASLTALLLCVAVPVAAQVGQRPFPKIEGGDDDTRLTRQPRPVDPVNRGNGNPGGRVGDGAGQDPLCLAERQPVLAFQPDFPVPASAAQIEPFILQWSKDTQDLYGARTVFGKSRDILTNPAALRQWADEDLSRIQAECGPRQPACAPHLKALHQMIEYRRCMVLNYLAALERNSADTGTSRQSEGVSGSRRGDPGDTGAPVLSPEAQGRTQALQQAIALGRQRQRDVDLARRGQPKRHLVAREAHACLKPQYGRTSVVNDCPYAIEYSYCVLHPAKDSWSGSFDCERGLSGSWQIGPGPGATAIMHTEGEAVYWFACRYGDTLATPDGVSPVDLLFQVGRGMLGRCSPWGAGSG